MNVLVCGVGGQGVLLFSDLVAGVALESGLDVKKSEVHGMAQRGGSVTSHIRYAPKVYSPLIEEGTADLLVAFEKLEALRYVHFLAPGGRLIYDPLRIEPLPVRLGLVERPDDATLDQRLAARAARRMDVPAFEIARELGSTRAQNVVILGAVAGFLDLPVDAFRSAIRTSLKPGLVELNLKAFESGQAAAACR
ncbi:indolepyruvate oxidoreductase subunit beta [candidate division WOR-3 bacterium]|nr:indolepyruvate oxidoreductase subunit beta [candidate division WOR-3 bacterium]